jgi:hypothetical protein
MAIKKPLVMNGGIIGQLQSGDTLAEVEQIQAVADIALTAGMVVCSSAAGHIAKAKADAVGTSKSTGLATADIGNGATGGYQTEGIISLTTGQWDAVFGTTGGLVFNTIYYLSAATAGNGTSTAPTTVGQFVRQVGIGLSTTDLKIEMGPLIQL